MADPITREALDAIQDRYGEDTWHHWKIMRSSGVQWSKWSALSYLVFPLSDFGSGDGTTGLTFKLKDSFQDAKWGWLDPTDWGADPDSNPPRSLRMRYTLEVLGDMPSNPTAFSAFDLVKLGPLPATGGNLTVVEIPNTRVDIPTLNSAPLGTYVIRSREFGISEAGGYLLRLHRNAISGTADSVFVHLLVECRAV